MDFPCLNLIQNFDQLEQILKLQLSFTIQIKENAILDGTTNIADGNRPLVRKFLNTVLQQFIALIPCIKNHLRPQLILQCTR